MSENRRHIFPAMAIWFERKGGIMWTNSHGGVILTLERGGGGVKYIGGEDDVGVLMAESM